MPVKALMAHPLRPGLPPGSLCGHGGRLVFTGGVDVAAPAAGGARRIRATVVTDRDGGSDPAAVLVGREGGDRCRQRDYPSARGVW